MADGYEVILPQEFENFDDEPDLFQQCVDGVDGAEVDAGVGFEMGVAWSKGIPIIALRTDFRRRAETTNGGLNLMLQYGATKVIEEDGDPFRAVVKAVNEFMEIE